MQDDGCTMCSRHHTHARTAFVQFGHRVRCALANGFNPEIPPGKYEMCQYQDFRNLPNMVEALDFGK